MTSTALAGADKKIIRKVEDAVQRRAEQHVVKFIDAVARQDSNTVHQLLSSGKVRFLSPGCPHRTWCKGNHLAMLLRSEDVLQSKGHDHTTLLHTWTVYLSMRPRCHVPIFYICMQVEINEFDFDSRTGMWPQHSFCGEI